MPDEQVRTYCYFSHLLLQASPAMYERPSPDVQIRSHSLAEFFAVPEKDAQKTDWRKNNRI